MGGRRAESSMRDGSRARRPRRRRVCCVAASNGGRRAARVPAAGPRPCSAKGRRAAGAVARDPVVWRRGRNPCACRVEETCAQMQSGQSHFGRLKNHATQPVICLSVGCYASHYWQISRCCVEYSSRAPHAAQSKFAWVRTHCK